MQATHRYEKEVMISFSAVQIGWEACRGNVVLASTG
jgi:hypothetical protein